MKLDSFGVTHKFVVLTQSDELNEEADESMKIYEVVWWLISLLQDRYQSVFVVDLD